MKRARIDQRTRAERYGAVLAAALFLSGCSSASTPTDTGETASTGRFLPPVFRVRQPSRAGRGRRSGIRRRRLPDRGDSHRRRGPHGGRQAPRGGHDRCALSALPHPARPSVQDDRSRHGGEGRGARPDHRRSGRGRRARSTSRCAMRWCGKASHPGRSRPNSSAFPPTCHPANPMWCFPTSRRA